MNAPAVTFTAGRRTVKGRLVSVRNGQGVVLEGARWNQATNGWRGRAYWVCPLDSLYEDT